MRVIGNADVMILIIALLIMFIPSIILLAIILYDAINQEK